MKICVVSDSHGNLNSLTWLGKKFKPEIDLFVHLGDDSDDASTLEEIGLKVIKVPGIYEPCYLPGQNTQRRIVTEFDNINVLITHTPSATSNDPTDEPSPQTLVQKHNVKIVLYGHTHIPKIEQIEYVIWLNPGHLKPDDKRGYPSSYAILEIKQNNIQIKIFELITGQLLKDFSSI